MVTNQQSLPFPPTNDLMFKRLCTDPDSRGILAGLITDFFDYQVKPDEIKMLSTESVTPHVFFAMPTEQQKALSVSRRDVTVEIIPANVTIEMQVLKDEFFIARSLYYVTQLYIERHGTPALDTDQSDTSKYQNLKPVWSLGILNHPMFHDDRPFRIAALSDEITHEFLTGQPFQGRPLRIGFFEIPKQLREPVETGDTRAVNRTAWAQFFDTGLAPDNAPAYIKEAAQIVHLVNTSPEESAMLTKQQEFIDDVKSAIGTQAFAAGKAEGIAEGEAGATRKLALNFLGQGLNPGTGLPLPEVQALAEKRD